LTLAVNNFDVVVIGGGAAGFFGAINTAIKNPKLKIVILEKTEKLLSKVKVSGGGRCNLTNECSEISQLIKNYPRGERELKKIFHKFTTTDTINWFEGKGVRLKAEDNGRMFPESNQSQTIIDLFLHYAQTLNIKIFTGFNVHQINNQVTKFEIVSTKNQSIFSKKVLITCGGFSKIEQYHFISCLGINIIPPVPSLFTFNLPQHAITKLMGTSIKNCKVRVLGFKTEVVESVLITHWGLSGPAILKLSSFCARFLNDKNYQFQFSVNWLGSISFEDAAEKLQHLANQHKKGLIYKYPLSEVPQRLWHFLLKEEVKLNEQKKWEEISKKEFNKLTETLVNHVFLSKGKTTFKEEFVTAGGIALNEIDLNTMQCKKIPNLFFAGEILDIDGVTGGFNFQNAWSTAYIASIHLAN